MIIANDLPAAAARSAVRVDERTGVDLEMSGWLGMYVCGWLGRDNLVTPAEQEPAAFAWMRARCFAKKRFDDFA
tara:strand:+ start:265 stop:486 length:222 start_codon:yes stop_codon:yes gene_type:complete